MSVDPRRLRVAILAAITNGATMNELLERWPVNDVAVVLGRQGLVVDDAGRITTRAGTEYEPDPREQLTLAAVQMAEHSPNPQVRAAARQALDRLERFAEVLEADRKVQRSDEFLRMQIAAAERWRAWCRAGMRDATEELVRLRKRRDMRFTRAQAGDLDGPAARAS